jgi:hypothetical protein
MENKMLPGMTGPPPGIIFIKKTVEVIKKAMEASNS